jgi:predicted MFS family arabinose efflux permease
VIAALRFVPKLPGQKGLEIDSVGIVLGVLTVLLVLFPLIEGRQLDWPMWIFGMLISSLPMLGLFVWWQRRRAAQGKAQLLPMALFKNRTYMVGTVLVMLLFAGIPGFFLVLAIFLQVGNGLTPLQSGLTTMPFSIGVLIASVAAGRLGNRWPRLRISVGGGLLTIAMLMFPFVVPQVGGVFSPVSFIVPMLIAGLGLGTSVSPMFNTVLSQVNERDTGSASGALQSFQQLGGALGLAVMGQLFFAHIAAKGPTASDLVPVYSDALSMALWFSTASFACMALLVWRLKKSH